jgi:hypothetical protein
MYIQSLTYGIPEVWTGLSSNGTVRQFDLIRPTACLQFKIVRRRIDGAKNQHYLCANQPKILKKID